MLNTVLPPALPPSSQLRGIAPTGADTRGRRMLEGLRDGTAHNPPAAATLALPPVTSWSPGLIR